MLATVWLRVHRPYLALHLVVLLQSLAALALLAYGACRCFNTAGKASRVGQEEKSRRALHAGVFAVVGAAAGLALLSLQHARNWQRAYKRELRKPQSHVWESMTWQRRVGYIWRLLEMPRRCAFEVYEIVIQYLFLQSVLDREGYYRAELEPAVASFLWAFSGYCLVASTWAMCPFLLSKKDLYTHIGLPLVESCFDMVYAITVLLFMLATEGDDAISRMDTVVFMQSLVAIQFNGYFAASYLYETVVPVRKDDTGAYRLEEGAEDLGPISFKRLDTCAQLFGSSAEAEPSKPKSMFIGQQEEQQEEETMQDKASVFKVSSKTRTDLDIEVKVHNSAYHYAYVAFFCKVAAAVFALVGIVLFVLVTVQLAQGLDLPPFQTLTKGFPGGRPNESEASFPAAANASVRAEPGRPQGR